MKMKQTLNLDQFRDAFRDYNRQRQNRVIALTKDNFSYEGLESLFNWFEELDCDIDLEGRSVTPGFIYTETELDVKAICCEFTEYENLEEFQADYSAEDYPDMEALENATTVIPINNSDSFIIQDF
jgi:hypothetical protein